MSTAKIDAVIVESSERRTAAEVAELIDMPAHWVRRQAARLGVVLLRASPTRQGHSESVEPPKPRRPRRLPPNHRRAWEPEDDEQFAALYVSNSAKACGEELGRTKRAVNTRAKKLGLIKLTALDARERKFVSKHLLRLGAEETARRLGRHVRTIRREAVRQGLPSVGWPVDAKTQRLLLTLSVDDLIPLLTAKLGWTAYRTRVTHARLRAWDAAR